MKITNEFLLSSSKSKEYTLELKDGTELIFSKYVYFDDLEDDSDWKFDDDSQKIYNKLPDDIQDDIYDFILEIKV